MGLIALPGRMLRLGKTAVKRWEARKTQRSRIDARKQALAEAVNRHEGRGRSELSAKLLLQGTRARHRQ